MKITLQPPRPGAFNFGCEIIAGLMLAGAVAANARGDSELTAAKIITDSQAAYAALSSFSAEGTSISTLGGSAVPMHTFAIKLARPGFYRIEWTQEVGTFVQKGAVWSAGSGDFMRLNESTPPNKYDDKQSALGAATGVSGGSASGIPGTFFALGWGNLLGASMKSAKLKPAEKVGGVDCYVLARESGGRTNTLWIGKQDLLIRQTEDDTSAATLREMFAAQAKLHPEFHAPDSAAMDTKTVLTLTNIKVNQPLKAADFAPHAAAATKP